MQVLAIEARAASQFEFLASDLPLSLPCSPVSVIASMATPATITPEHQLPIAAARRLLDTQPDQQARATADERTHVHTPKMEAERQDVESDSDDDGTQPAAETKEVLRTPRSPYPCSRPSTCSRTCPCSSKWHLWCG
jgi:hypothetical protein